MTAEIEIPDEVVDAVALELLMQTYTPRTEKTETHARDRWALAGGLRRAYRLRARAVLDAFAAAALPLLRAQVAAELIAQAREVQAAIDDPATDQDTMGALIDEAEGLWSAVRTVDEATWRREYEAT